MEEGGLGGVSGFFRARRTFVELAIVAIVLAVATGLISTAISESANMSVGRHWILGLVLVVAALGVLLVRALPSLDRCIEVDGLLVITKEGKVVTPIDRYDASEALARYFKGLFAENKALQQVWEAHPLQDFRYRQPNRAEWQPSPALKLLREAVEYHALHELSLHLSGHFNGNPDVKDEHVVELGRKHIPHILLENRFLELFSRPMEEREAFIDPKRSARKEVVVYAGGKGGAIFDHFELILPRESVVSKHPQDGLVITTPRFSLSLKVDCEGYNSIIPRGFDRLYMGLEFPNYSVLKFGITAEVRFRRRGFLKTEGWEAYRWVDGFLERIDSEFGFERFLSRIGWDTAYTTAQILERRVSEAASKRASGSSSADAVQS